MKPDQHARGLNAIMRDLMDTRDGTTYIAGRVWGVDIRYDLGAHHPLLGRSVPHFEFEDGTRLGALLHEGQGLLIDFTMQPSLKMLAGEYGGQIRYVSGRAKAQLGLCALMVRPDGIVVWVSDGESEEYSLRHAAARWFNPLP